MNKSLPILFTVLFNCIPIVGVALYGWMPFEMFWLFWMETLIIAVFNCIRVLYSQGHQPHELHVAEPLHINTQLAFKYLLGRIFIFLFYSVFIIVFIGFISTPSSESLNIMETLVFANRFFNLALLLSIVSQAYYLVRYFFMNRAYYYTSPASFSALFDGRQIVMHIAVVLGAVGSTFLFKGNSNPQYAAVFMIAIFCIVKCVYELYLGRTSENYEAKQV